MSEFEAFYKDKREVISATDMWGAKQKAIKLFRVPKKDMNMIAIQSLTAKVNGEFRMA